MNKKSKEELAREVKRQIVDLFNSKVRGKKPDTSESNIGHDGKGGHWLEVQMGVPHNASNSADLNGFEMKDDTSSKTTFGDWSANYYIFKHGDHGISRDEFMKIFGAPNPEKKGRYSWSGKPTPKLDSYNSFGQILTIDQNNNILATYSYEKDLRPDKKVIVPKDMQKNNLVLARWDSVFLRVRVERKFNKLGWFKCVRNADGVYTNIVFGKPINFDFWITEVKKGNIYFDSGMYQGNSRNYSQWRADNKYWDSLITDTY